jgi:hypothetical protein
MSTAPKSLPSRTRGVLRTTTAVVCALAVATGPVATPALAAPTGLRSLDGVEVKIGASDSFTKVEFRGLQGSRATIRQDGRTVIVRLPKGSAPNIARLRVDPPKGVAGVDTREAPEGFEILIALAPQAEARFGRADGAVFLNLFPSPSETTRAAQAAAAANPPLRKLESLKVTATTEGHVLSLHFPWRAPVGSAVFRREGAVWIVFDAAADLDMPNTPQTLGSVQRVRWTRTGDATVIRVEAPEAVSVNAIADGPMWTVVFGAPVPDQPSAVKVARDDQTGRPVLTAALAGARKVIWLADPAVGDRFAAVTAPGPTKGLDRRRGFVEGALLKTVQGVAIEATASDLSVTLDGDLVRISRPGGMELSPPRPPNCRNPPPCPP